MSIHVKASSEIYEVDPDSNVTVRVTIGDAQAGGWLVAWDDENVVAKGSDPATVSIGRGKDLKNRTLQVAATAIDVRPETNRLSSTLVINGGSQGQKQLLSRWDEGDDGDVAIFTTMIGFR